MQTRAQIEEHLTGMGHGSTLKAVRNIDALMERAASMTQAQCKPLETIRTLPLASAIYDDFYNYALADDFNDLIDLIPQDDRELWDKAFRNPAGQFDIQKAIRQKTISIEGNNGRKTIRINWRSRKPKVFNSMNSYTNGGTWTAVGSAANVATDTVFKVSGGASVVFDHNASGDGIQLLNGNSIDLTTENGISNEFVWVYFSAIPTSATFVWGNDLTTKYWTSPAITTQADGTPFKVGWNLLSTPWASAAQTGVVAPATIDSAKLTFASSDALGKIRVDNITFAIGRPFDMKFYSKYFFIDKDTVTWKSRPTSPDDFVLVDNDTLPIFLFECLQEMAQQMEGTDGAFDITYAEKRLATLYPIYRGRNPSMVKKSVTSYGGAPRYGAGSWNRFRRR